MKKPPGDQSVRYFVHGRDPVWVYREEDYKRMINMDNNPVPASRIDSPARGDRAGRDDQNCTWFRSRTSRARPGVAGPIWRRAARGAQAGPGPAPDPDRARGGGARGRPLGVDPQLLGPADAGHVSRKASHCHAISADTEYFCPMDPGVVSDWPGRCGICNMALVRRKRGEALALPDGVVARMQLSPYRIQLAGIQTAPATFQPLVREFESSGIVARTGDAATVLAGDTRAAGALDRPGPDRRGDLCRPAGPRRHGGSGPSGGDTVAPTAGNIFAPRSP